MGGLAGIASLMNPKGGMPLPPLPGNLGLPEKSNRQGAVTTGGRDRDMFVGNSQRVKYEQERVKADAFNKAFTDLLNQQPQLTGNERKQLYDAYGDKFVGDFKTIGNTKGLTAPTDYSSQLSQLTPEQFKAQQQQQQQQQVTAQQAAPAPAPQGPPQPVANVQPDTVGATPQQQPAATPTVATPTGNVAGGTTTLNEDSKVKGAGRRGRVATLLTGLGGAVERFGL